jgi:hypothetical protein
MNRLLLSEARDALMTVVSYGGVSEQFFVPQLNQVQERLFTLGRWPGMQEVLDFPTQNGYITLPRRCESVLGAQVAEAPAHIFGRHHEFTVGGPGPYPEGMLHRLLADMGGGYCTALDLPQPSRLKVLSTSVEDTAPIDFSDVDQSGAIFSPDAREAVAPGSTSVRTFNSVSFVVKPVTVGTVSLYAVDPTTLAETLVAVYEPGETTPSYRRYKVTGAETSDSVRVLCKRQFVPVAAANDEVFPGNIGALKHGLLALNYEDQGDVERARASWAMALELLQGALKQERGGEVTVARRSGFGVGKIRMRL